ncbi:MAG: hypothetical protein P8X94_14070 [Woeseiaceae bacterium]
MKFDQYPVGIVCTRIVPENMATGNKKQLLAAGIEEPTGIGEMLLVLEGRYPGDSKQQRVNHRARLVRKFILVVGKQNPLKGRIVDDHREPSFAR